MLGLVVFGSRTWMCTMAAPALAPSIAEAAIASGVTGTAGLRPGVSAEPVTAHEMITLRAMAPPDARLHPAPAALLRDAARRSASYIVGYSLLTRRCRVV